MAQLPIGRRRAASRRCAWLLARRTRTPLCAPPESGGRAAYRLKRVESVLEGEQYSRERVESSFGLCCVTPRGPDALKTIPLVLHNLPSPFDLMVGTLGIVISHAHRTWP